MSELTAFSDKTVSVTEVNATIKACFDSPIYKGLEVFGEISGHKMSGPHAYFTLKDKYSQLSCVCFNAARTYRPKDGESVIVRGSLDYYVKGGKLSLQATEILPMGQGLLFLEFERLKRKLSEEGLFAVEHKKAIPAYGSKVLAVTSASGAVIRDIVATIRRKNPIIDIVVKDVRVQGAGAGRDIAAVLRRVDALGYDVIILARGGGSLEDLAPFYDEGLARTVYAMKTPIISAVGHETDYSLADFVADARAATPTAAAELAAYDYYALRDRVLSDAETLKRNAVKVVERKSMRARLAAEKLRTQAVAVYSDRTAKLQRLCYALRSAALRKSDAAEYRLKSAVDALDNLSPLKILKRGYFRIRTEDGEGVKIKELKRGDRVTASGGDGSFDAEVTEIYVAEDRYERRNKI